MKNYKFCLFAALVLILPLVPFYLKLTSRGHVCPATARISAELSRERVVAYSDYLMIEAGEEDPHIPFLDSFEGSSTNGAWVTMLAINNTRAKDWLDRDKNTVLTILVRSVERRDWKRYTYSDIYLAVGRDIWKAEVDIMQQKYIWNLINQHHGALEKCSGKELLEELAKRSVNGLSKITDS